MPKNFVITKKEQGKRLDKFLTEKFPKFSRSWLQKLVRDGKILVNNKPAKPKYLLKEHDKIKAQVSAPAKIELEPEPSIKFKVIYEDKDVIVIDKPAGLVVHPSRTSKRGTLVNGLLSRYPKIKNIGEDPLRPGIVHRLDKDTSGLMVVAKNNKAFQYLKKQFKTRKVEKRYIALVVGQLKAANGVIDKPVARSKRDPEKMTVTITGRKAETFYKVIKRFKNYTLVEAAPKTGRTHQIRVHFGSIRYPLTGDKVYGFKRQPCPKGLSRHFLHANYLKFKLPSGKVGEFRLPLPKELKKVLNNL